MFLLVFALLLDLTFGQNSCNLFDDTECVSLKDCDYFNSFEIRRSFPTHRMYIEMLEDFNCGYDLTGPMVCCPETNHNSYDTSDEMSYTDYTLPRIYSPFEYQPLPTAQPSITQFPLSTQRPTTVRPLLEIPANQYPSMTQPPLIGQPPLVAPSPLVTQATPIIQLSSIATQIPSQSPTQSPSEIQPPSIIQLLSVTQPPLAITQISSVTQAPITTTRIPLDTQPPIVTQAPIAQSPTTQALTTQAPTTQAPTTQAPITQASTTQAPTTQAPITQASTTQAPTTQAPTTQAPTTQAPTTQAPITQAPTTRALTTQAPSTTIRVPLVTQAPITTTRTPLDIQTSTDTQTVPITQAPSTVQTPPVTQVSVSQEPPTLSNQNEERPPSIDGLSAVNLLSTSCGEIENLRILNGNVTEISQFPWMVLLSYRDSDGLTNFYCGGSVINERYILTAAHCLTSLPTGRVLVGVRLGEHNLVTNPDCENLGDVNNCADPYQDIGIESIIPHPDFSISTLQNDIGLIRLARPYNSSSNILPICLPLTAGIMNKNITGEIMKITGWGLTESNTRSQELLQADLSIISNAECRNSFSTPGSINITSSQMCAGDNISRACLGDSGGPIIDNEEVDGVLRYVQHGVISVGSRECNSNRPIPGVFARVSYYMNWILNEIRE